MMINMLWVWLGLPLLVSILCFKTARTLWDILLTTGLSFVILWVYPFSSTSLSMLLLLLLYFLSLYHSEKSVLTAMLYYLLGFAIVELTGELVHALPFARSGGSLFPIYRDSLLVLLLVLFFSGMVKSILVKYISKSSYLEPFLLFVGAVVFLYYFRRIYLFEVLSERGEVLVADTVTGIIGGIFFLLILVLLLNRRSETLNAQSHQAKMQYQISLDYTNGLERHYQEMRKFKHDYQNILLSLEGFLKEREYEQLEAYYYAYIQPTTHQLEGLDVRLSDLTKVCNLEIKSLLYTKLNFGAVVGGDVYLEVKEKVKIRHHLLPVVRCLGIVLDNAIEAIEELGAGVIEVAFINAQQGMCIVVRNTCSPDTPPLYRLQQEGFSTKGSNRGLGLTNLEELLQGVPVLIETTIDGGFFSQTLTLLEKEDT